MFQWVKKVVRVKEWSDWERNKSFLIYLKELFSNFFQIQLLSEVPPKQFEEVVKQYQLKEKDLKEQAHIFKNLFYFFLSIFTAIFIYALYMLYNGNYFVSFVIICISLIAFCLAFRYHFYLTLLQNKSLNFTLKDWFRLTFKRK